MERDLIQGVGAYRITGKCLVQASRNTSPRNNTLRWVPLEGGSAIVDKLRSQKADVLTMAQDRTHFSAKASVSQSLSQLGRVIESWNLFGWK